MGQDIELSAMAPDVARLQELLDQFGGLWAETLADPGLDLEAVVRRRLEPLARRLDLVLGQ